MRALDPADTPNPAFDLTAVYLRRAGNRLQIRVDLLSYQTPNELSLDIEIGDASALGATSLVIHVPSEDGPARISFDPLLATVTIDIPLSGIASLPRVDVSTPEDKLSGLTLDGPVLTQTAPLLLTFYEAFAARFPAEALRSWDGAHTGPRGERHGLKHLLDAVEEYQTPVVLLDMKEPENVSALDAMAVLPRIRRMVAENLLVLPEVASQPDLTGFCESCQALELPASHLAFDSAQADYQFNFLEDSGHLYKPILSRITSIPIATESDINQPAPDGPSIEVRRALLETALNMDEIDLLVLGGSLRESTWGSPDMVRATLAYFASRPYIHILTAGDLLNFPAKFGRPKFQPPPANEPISQLETHYNHLTQPVLDFAANWEGSLLSTCDTDIDQDNQPECLLANQQYLAILDPLGARLIYLFAMKKAGSPPSQLIGPSWQVAVGLSNPSLWDTAAGEAADPGAYPGAFADADDPFKAYEPFIEENRLIFTSPDGTRTKIFDLIGSGLEVEYRTQESVNTQIPLLVIPDMRFTQGWAEKYVQEETPGGVAWGLQTERAALSSPAPVERSARPGSAARAGGPGSKGHIMIWAFNEALSLLASPEDPDFDYPPGHYIPFPMAIAELQLESGTSTVQITVSP